MAHIRFQVSSRSSLRSHREVWYMCSVLLETAEDLWLIFPAVLRRLSSWWDAEARGWGYASRSKDYYEAQWLVLKQKVERLRNYRAMLKLEWRSLTTTSMVFFNIDDDIPDIDKGSRLHLWRQGCSYSGYSYQKKEKAEEGAERLQFQISVEPQRTSLRAGSISDTIIP